VGTAGSRSVEKLTQKPGITTVVTDQRGFSPAPVTKQSIALVDDFGEMLRDQEPSYPWRSMAEFLDSMEDQGVLLNAAFLVGHGTVRYAAMAASIISPSATATAMPLLSRKARRMRKSPTAAGTRSPSARVAAPSHAVADSWPW
jgi:N-acyl-D-aspartate/D-glutamate deacylase